MKTFKQKVARRWRWWVVSSVVVLALVLAIGWALLSMFDDVGNKVRYLSIIGGMLVALAFFLGQAVQSILVRSWDTWISDLGPTQIEMMIPALKDQKEKLIKEE